MQSMGGEVMKHRVVCGSNIWTDDKTIFPEERPRWWPFWFRFDDGTGQQVSFKTEDAAWRFIHRQNAKDHPPQVG
jgi:hypothetical protein